MWASEWRAILTAVNTQLTRVAFVNNEFWVAVFGIRVPVAGFQSGGEKCRYLECAVISNVSLSRMCRSSEYRSFKRLLYL
jgi:hypothetical protein